MPRAATTADVFNAIAEPRRRDIIDLLSRRHPKNAAGHAVGELVRSLRMTQPAVSKHLSVLRQVGVVTVIKHGRHRLYRLEAKELKPVHDWAATFEQFWTHHVDRIKQRAERAAAAQSAPKKGTP
jgi:DNA-binding transcriptional ArsR family regulator